MGFHIGISSLDDDDDDDFLWWGTKHLSIKRFHKTERSNNSIIYFFIEHSRYRLHILRIKEILH